MWSIAGSLTVQRSSTAPTCWPPRWPTPWPDSTRRPGTLCGAEIDPDVADTAAFCATYGSPLSASANCVVVAGKREGEQRYAACLVLATARADVNGVVRRRLDVRKASFAPMDDAVARTGMAYGGITPFGLPAGWPLLIDAAVAAAPELIVAAVSAPANCWSRAMCSPSCPAPKWSTAWGRPIG